MTLSINVYSFLGMKKIQEFISYEQNLNDLLDNDEQSISSMKAVFAEFFKLDKKVFEIKNEQLFFNNGILSFCFFI